jgi:hypothetical protein
MSCQAKRRGMLVSWRAEDPAWGVTLMYTVLEATTALAGGIPYVLYHNSSFKSQQSSQVGALVKSVVSLVFASLVRRWRATLNCLSSTHTYLFISFHS